MELQKQLAQSIVNIDIAPSIVGQLEVKHDVKSALLSGRNIILVGPPGIGKTTLVRQLSDILPKKGDDKAPFVRVQGSPDLTAEDLLGDIDPVKALEFGPLSEQAFTPGKIFKANGGVLFFDEVNRAPQKLQNALLQVLEERKATIGGYDVDFDADFILVATMNPQDDTTEDLSSVFLDRFDMIYCGYPESITIEKDIITQNGTTVGDVKVPEDMAEHIVRFVRKLRKDKNLVKVPSVRATLGLYERAQANALLDGRKAVEKIDVDKAIPSVLSHRIELKPSLKYAQSTEQYLQEQVRRATGEHASSDGEADVP